MEIKEIVIRINYFRNERNMSASELSGRINKHEGYISALEVKNFNLPTSVLMDILEVLEVTPQKFFADNYRTFEQDEHLQSLIKKLDKEKKELIIKLIEK